MLYYVKIIRYCIKYYNIFSFEEIKDFLTIKTINFNSKIKVGKVIVYSINNEIKCDYIYKIIDGKLVLSTTIIEIPQYYICLNFNIQYKIIELVLYFTVLFLMLLCAFINIRFSILFFICACFLKHNNIIILNMCFITILLNVILFNNFYYIISILILLFMFINKKIFYFSFVPFMFFSSTFELNLFVVYFMLMVLYKLYNDYHESFFNDIFLKAMIKIPIYKIHSIKINNMIINDYGMYFYEVDNQCSILINNTNLKFLAIENIYNELEIVYVKNINSFFTNKQKYSKIDNVSKYYIYLKNI